MKNIKSITIITITVVVLIVLSVFNTQRTHTDIISKYSIQLPWGWDVIRDVHATTTSDILFGDGESTIAVKRFDRTEPVENAINFMGKDEFMVFLSDQLKLDIEGYNIISTSTVKIGDKEFYALDSKYVGRTTQKDVTSKAYIILTDSSYYILGVDVYSESWDKKKDAIIKSINTFKLI
jgi:hypothetical protein